MNQVDQTPSNTDNNNISSMPVAMETLNVAANIRPYARASLPPRKCRPSPFNNKPNKSNPGSPEGPGPIRRPLSRSQISVPVNARISRGDGPSEPASSSHLSTIPNPLPEPHPLTPYVNQIHGPAQSQPRPQLHNPLHTVDKAFTLYSDRLYSSLHEFRAVCTTLIVHEQGERRRVHALCLKIMRERDLARQKVDALLMDSAAGAGADVDVKREHQRKRSWDYGAVEGVEELPSSAAGYVAGATLSSPRAVCPLNTSLSPVVSPEGSPYIAPILSSPRFSGSASAPSTSSSYMGLTSTAPRSSSSPKRHVSRSLSPLDIGLRASDDHDTGAATQSTPPLKRRKSSDSSSFSSSSSAELPPLNPAPLLKTEAGSHSGYRYRTKADLDIGTVLPPGNFEYMDIMYIPSKSQDGTLVCRACLLVSTKSKFMPPSPLSPDSKTSLPSPTSPTTIGTTTPSSPKLEPDLTSKSQTNVIKTLFGPTSFPAGTSWDVLRDHCVLEHPKECADVNKLHPAEVWELRRRLGGR